LINKIKNTIKQKQNNGNPLSALIEHGNIGTTDSSLNCERKSNCIFFFSAADCFHWFSCFFLLLTILLYICLLIFVWFS